MNGSFNALQLSAQDVHFSNIIGVESNCLHLDGEGFCTVQTTNTVVLKDIDPDQLYGITLCAIKEPNSTSLNIFDIPKKRRPRAHPILVNPRAIVEFNQRAILFGIPSSLIIGVVISIMMVFCIWYGRKRTEENLNRLKVSQIHADQVEHSKKTDIWEVDRRNLIIYQDNKLGAGAFGAVYLGKLVGRSIGHEHSKSPLGVHLMRVDNCEVAVKMLPEVSFSHSRNEFLREIALMKTLGFHENLMNMLACVTESEPLCLVVEYCNNGDLLRYLRERCEYMMQLTESGVNYEEDVVDMNYDPDQIVTKRQLLAYAVQISFGLEYLAQSGFVHRDVACRNMLLHHKKVCKIGDFGLCRKMSLEDDQYCRKGGRLPLKWMSPESISQFSFSTKSDVWSFGVFLYELVTLGGTPYVGILPQDLLPWLEHGKRMEQPDNCPDKFYAQMLACWSRKAEDRPDFSTIRSHLADQLEELTEEYGYMKLDAQKEYYHFKYKNDELDVIVIPDNGTKEEQPVILCDHKDSLN